MQLPRPVATSGRAVGEDARFEDTTAKHDMSAQEVSDFSRRVGERDSLNEICSFWTGRHSWRW